MRSLLPILAVPYAPGPPASRPMPHAQPSVDREWEGVTIPAHRKRVGSRRGLLVMMGILGGLVVFAFFLYGVVFARPGLRRPAQASGRS